MEAILNVYYALPPEVWAFVAGTPLIVVFVNVCKKLFGVNSTLVIHSLTVTTSVLLTVLPEVLAHNPKPGLYNTAFVTAFFTFANFLYAASKKLQPFLDDVKAYEDKKATTATNISPVAPGVASVSSTTGVAPAVVQIPVQEPPVFEG